MQGSENMRNKAASGAMVAALVLLPITANAAPPASPPVGPDDIYEPIEIPSPPPPPAAPPPPVPEPAVVPEPTPEPDAPPIEGPQPAPVGPEQLTKIKGQRNAGIAVMATGGVFAATGFGMTFAFTLLGDRAEGEEQPELEDIERNNTLAQVGGVALATGVALVAVGGILFANANRKAEQRKLETMARVRVVPSVGGLVVSGQF
jgi:hypothetical protein